MPMPKTALIAILTAAISLGGVSAAASADTPPTAQPAPNNSVVDPCMYGEPIDTTVVTPDGKPAAPTDDDCPLAVIPWGAQR